MRTASPEGTRRRAIVESALARFARDGAAQTTLRAVAKDAGVSPALVVHHFGGREGLERAVEAYALDRFAAAYAAEPLAGPPREMLRMRAAQTAAVMRRHPDVCAYLGQALVSGTAGSAALFDRMIAGGARDLDALEAAGAVRADSDRMWRTIQHFLLIYAPLAFRPLIERQLDGGLLDDENLTRWVDANIDLLERGLYR